MNYQEKKPHLIFIQFHLIFFRYAKTTKHLYIIHLKKWPVYDNQLPELYIIYLCSKMNTQQLEK